MHVWSLVINTRPFVNLNAFQLRDSRVIAYEAIWKIWENFHLSVLARIQLSILKLWVSRAFFTFYKFSLLVKLSFIFYRGRRYYTKPRKLLCLIFFIFIYHHIYISLKITVTILLIIDQPALSQHPQSDLKS